MELRKEKLSGGAVGTRSWELGAGTQFPFLQISGERGSLPNPLWGGGFKETMIGL